MTYGEESNIDLDFIGNEEVFNQEELTTGWRMGN